MGAQTASTSGTPARTSYYRWGVRRRTSQITSTPGAAPRAARCGYSRESHGRPTGRRRHPDPGNGEAVRVPLTSSRVDSDAHRARNIGWRLVIDGIDGPRDAQVAALIGRVDRRGRLLWSLPKGHIELGETAEQTAIREVAEETGIRGSVLAALGRIDYWFVTDGRRVHKTVHHYLMRFLGGELSDEDLEVAEVAWVPIRELPSRLAYADERRLARWPTN